MNANRLLKDARQLEQLVRPFQEFAKLEASGGILFDRLLGDGTRLGKFTVGEHLLSSLAHGPDFRFRGQAALRAFAFLDQRWSDGVVLPARRVGDQAGNADW